jgi:hypothetical protein
MEINEHIPSELDIFSSNPYQLAIESYENHELSPVNTLDANNIVEFHCNGYTNKMKSLNDIYLYAKIQVVKSDNKLYTATEEPQGYLANGILTSLFRSCNFYLNNNLIVAVNDHFGIQEYIQLSLNFSPTVASSKLSNQGFYSASETTKLKDHTKGSKTVDLMAKLNLVNTEKLLIPNTSISIKLGFQNSDFYINETSTTSTDINGTATSKQSSSKLIIHDLKLYIKHAQLREQYLLYNEKLLMQKYSAIYEWKYGNIISSTLSGRVL